jgi:hypothetical protein
MTSKIDCRPDSLRNPALISSMRQALIVEWGKNRLSFLQWAEGDFAFDEQSGCVALDVAAQWHPSKNGDVTPSQVV